MGLITNSYKKRLNRIKKGVVRKFNQGKPAKWRNRNFEDLSFEINKATKVLISAATLKRIFGKNKTSQSYYPQESTLDAMEQYSGSIHPVAFGTRKWIAISIPALVVLTGLIILFSTKNDKTTTIHGALKLVKIEGATPTTAFLSYQIPKTNDTFFISYGDDYPPKALSSTSGSISHVYNFPGLFSATIQTKKRIISDTLKILVPTNGWQALASYYQHAYNDRYYPIPMSLSLDENGFHCTRKNLANIGIDTTKIIQLRLDNFQRTNASGDNFTLKTRLKNSNYWPAVRCYSAYIKVFGENGAIIIKFTNKGCSGFGEFTLSEKSGHGTTNDLSGLALDIKNWNNIQINNTDKKVQVLVNTAVVFQENYSKPIGKVVGVSLQFHGSGYVDYFKMYDQEDKAVFTTNF